MLWRNYGNYRGKGVGRVTSSAKDWLIDDFVKDPYDRMVMHYAYKTRYGWRTTD